MLYINVCKTEVQNHFHNKSTSDLTLLVDFYGCCMETQPETESLGCQIIVTIGAV